MSDLDGVIWVHAKNRIKAGRKLTPRETGIEFTLTLICCERGYSMRYDAEELAQAVDATKGPGMRDEPVTAAEIEALRLKLLKLKFFAEHDGVWTPHPHIYMTEDPYKEDAA